jgi:hypothetical protein
MNLRYIRRFLVFFFIFATGSGGNVSGGGDKHRHSNISLFNKNICKRNCSIVCVGKASKIRRAYNPYAVVAKDVLRKYFYIMNVVVIYIILYSL